MIDIDDKYSLAFIFLLVGVLYNIQNSFLFNLEHNFFKLETAGLPNETPLGKPALQCLNSYPAHHRDGSMAPYWAGRKKWYWGVPCGVVAGLILGVYA